MAAGMFFLCWPARRLGRGAKNKRVATGRWRRGSGARLLVVGRARVGCEQLAVTAHE